MWQYRGEILRVVDGDTLDVRIDCGFHISTTQRLRLLGVDTPERSDPGWAEATAFTAAYCPVGRKVIIETEKSDSFGRYLAKVTPVDEQDGVASGSVNDALLSSGHAVPYAR